eukprot:TRINITY_DN16042_c0_g1_i1.p1 TRINITY_DN16042_c0_g1~~TRINITY_DN16042_c0_g1_i1.p1  ORF type:complete len:150 (+),score=15.80 TRINITY_DN16042_c0_g1_i1:209-658(+)
MFLARLILIVGFLCLLTLSKDLDAPPGHCFWQYCEDMYYPAQVNEIRISPDPPIRGYNVDLFVNISLSENLTNGKAGVDVRFMNYPIFNQSFFICDQLKCPLYAKVHLFNETFAVPNDIPCGDYFAVFDAVNQFFEQVVCVWMKCSIGC